MSHTTRHRLRLFVVLVGLVVLAGLLYAFLFPGPQMPDYAHTAFAWFVGGSLIWSFELFFVPSVWGAPIRRLQFLAVLLVKALVLCAIIVFTAVFVRLVLHGHFDPALFGERTLYWRAGYVFVVVIALFAAMQVSRLIGGRVLLNFILGRYHRPVSEDRVFMFLDLVGSTALAERLGDVGVQALITRFFFDVAEPIIESGGEIHRYVGDSVVVTWPLREGTAIVQAIRCYFGIVEKIRKLAPEYEHAFATVPEFRAGIHGGPVVVSECGDYKQEIVFFGDTVNTSARIEQQCKALNCPILVSGDLLQRAELPAPFTAESKGFVQLRGRENETELFTIDRRGA